MATDAYVAARRDQSIMMRQGRSFSGHERNCCFLNTADGRFANASATTGFDFADDGRSVAVVDWDLDGRLDLWMGNRNAPRLRFLRNQSKNENNWIAFQLRGNGSTTNADGIGARVTLQFRDGDNKTLTKSLRAGEGFLSQSSKWIHFGLQDSQHMSGVRVDWPGGNREDFIGIEANRRYELGQGSGRAKLAKIVAQSTDVAPSVQEARANSSVARIPLTTLTPMTDVSYQELASGEARTIDFANQDHSSLIVLWASWCPACIAELNELSRHAAELRSAGIEVVALCVDRVAEPNGNPSTAVAAINQLEFPFRSGWASRELVEQLQLIHDSFILMSLPLPVPSSFLIDARGRLSVIYKGPSELDRLLEDSRHSQRSRTERFQAAAQLSGSMIDHADVAKSQMAGELISRLRLARAFRDTGRLEFAMKHFADAAQLAPDSALAQFGRGDIALRQNNLTDAIEYLQSAILLNPGHAESHFRLALALEKLSRYTEAVAHYRLGLDISPDFVQGANNLAWILATNPQADLRNGKEALDWAKKCAEATRYRDAGILDSLAACYAEIGDFENAITVQSQAIKLVPPSAKSRFTERYLLYQSGRPFRAKTSGVHD